MTSAALSLTATAVSLTFAAIVFQQYRSRRRPYQAVWSVALLLFGIGTLCQFIAAIGGWNPTVYRVWYFTGALAVAAYLGQGTIYLMAPRRIAHRLMTALALISLIGLALVVAQPVNLSTALAGGHVTGNGFAPLMLIILIPLNTYGTVAMVGGAIWSGYRFWQQGSARPGAGRRALGNFLIAAGALTTALGGTLTRLGIPELLYVTELAGVVVIFVGYLQTTVKPTLAAGVPRAATKSLGGMGKPGEVT